MSSIEIKQSELRALLESENTTEEELNIYFEPGFDDAFKPALVLRDNVVIIPDEGDANYEISIMGLVINLANSLARRKRNKKYRERITEDPQAVRILSEGDSWFQHPHPKVLDIIDQLSNHYPVYCIGAAGDTVRNMFYEAEFLKAMKDEGSRIFLMSGGGNDILGDSFRNYLLEADEDEPGKRPERFLKQNFLRELESIGNIYKTVFEKLKNEDIDVIVHGYDYVIPLDVPDKGWVGRYMLEKRINHADDRKAVIHFMMDKFNETMSAIAANYPRVHYLDLRKIVRDDQWFDEIHPTSDGFQDIALKYHALIQEITG